MRPEAKTFISQAPNVWVEPRGYEKIREAPQNFPASVSDDLLCLLPRFLEFFSYYFPECIFQAFIMRLNMFS